MRRQLTVALLAALGAALALSPIGPTQAQPAPKPTPKSGIASRAEPAGDWILDPRGRALILHGLNMVSKRPPYAPDAVGFGRDDARFLARNGFTTVRLGLIWKGVEPRPGHYDDAYLARIRKTAQSLAGQGIWVLLDMHQDLYSEGFQGEGAPEWAVQDDGLPHQPQLGFPGNYFAMPALNRAFDHFWANDAGPGRVGLQDRYAAAWAHVATYFRGTPRILGLDLFNEPWPGTGWQLCANPVGCPEFDSRLEAFSQRVIDAIRAVDRRTPVFYEPNVLFNNGASTSVTPTERNLGFSFHDYCLTAEADAEGGAQQLCDAFDGLVFDNAAAHTEATGHPSLLTEFGATTDQGTIRTMVDRAGQALIGWQFWAYCGCEDPTTTGPGAVQALVLDPEKRPAGANVDQAKLASLVVPHPLAVAGTPASSRFDRSTGVLDLTWTTERAGGTGRSGDGRFPQGSRTTISVPKRAYPHGYTVQVTGARVVSERNARVLVVAQRRGADQVHLTVTPGHSVE